MSPNTAIRLHMAVELIMASIRSFLSWEAAGRGQHATYGSREYVLEYAEAALCWTHNDVLSARPWTMIDELANSFEVDWHISKKMIPAAVAVEDALLQSFADRIGRVAEFVGDCSDNSIDDLAPEVARVAHGRMDRTALCVQHNAASAYSSTYSGDPYVACSPRPAASQERNFRTLAMISSKALCRRMTALGEMAATVECERIWRGRKTEESAGNADRRGADGHLHEGLHRAL